MRRRKREGGRKREEGDRSKEVERNKKGEWLAALPLCCIEPSVPINRKNDYSPTLLTLSDSFKPPQWTSGSYVWMGYLQRRVARESL